MMDGQFWEKSKIQDFWGSGPGWMYMDSVCVVWRHDMWSGDMICGVETGYVVWNQDTWCGDMVCGLGTWYMSSGYRI